MLSYQRAVSSSGWKAILSHFTLRMRLELNSLFKFSAIAAVNKTSRFYYQGYRTGEQMTTTAPHLTHTPSPFRTTFRHTHIQFALKLRRHKTKGAVKVLASTCIFNAADAHTRACWKSWARLKDTVLSLGQRACTALVWCTHTHLVHRYVPAMPEHFTTLELFQPRWIGIDQIELV